MRTAVPLLLCCNVRAAANHTSSGHWKALATGRRGAIQDRNFQLQQQPLALNIIRFNAMRPLQMSLKALIRYILSE